MHFSVLVIDRYDRGYDELLDKFYIDSNKYEEEIVANVDDAIKWFLKYYPALDPYEEGDGYEEYLDFGRDMFGGDRVDDEHNIVADYNPNAKYDCYSLGGRFADDFSLVQGKLKEFDFEPNMDRYNEYMRYWEIVVEEDELKPDESRSDFSVFYRKEHLLDEYKTKENFAKFQSSFTTYAILIDDTWVDQDEFGSIADYHERYLEIINRLLEESPDAEATLIDCHI